MTAREAEREATPPGAGKDLPVRDADGRLVAHLRPTPPSAGEGDEAARCTVCGDPPGPFHNVNPDLSIKAEPSHGYRAPTSPPAPVQGGLTGVGEGEGL